SCILGGGYMKAVVLAAGKGKRIGSEKEGTPKAMRIVNGRPMIDYVVKELAFVDEIILVVGYKKEQVYDHLGNKYSYAVQEEQLGTGHAVKCASEFFSTYDGPVLVTFGDMPLLTAKTYKKVFKAYNDSIKKNDPAACVMLSVLLKDVSLPYGRVLRDSKKAYVRIIEEPDCNDEQKKINEVFFGVMLFNGIKLNWILNRMTNRNAQNEYYLTDLPTLLKEEGEKVIICSIQNQEEVFGVNTMDDLNRVEEIMKTRGNND
ncbi:MAG TPA: NTP transferase domain-containing protein, partial [Clostridia bacterium]|nr:NTP transferase domain-containing protein [Clostridia bacterium]